MGGLGPKMEGFPTPGQVEPGFSENPAAQPETHQQSPESPAEQTEHELPQSPINPSDELVEDQVELESVSHPVEVPLDMIGSNEVSLEQAQVAMRSLFESQKEND